MRLPEDDDAMAAVRLRDGVALVRAVEDARGRPGPKASLNWADFGSPVIDRGAHAIFPVAVGRVPDGSDRDDAVGEICHRVQRHCVHFYGGDGFHAETHLEGGEGYGRNVLDTGLDVVGAVFAWRIVDLAAVLVRAVDRERGLDTLAFHVLPASWVWFSPLAPKAKRDLSRSRRVARERAAADASWTWPLPDA